jgi:hypothetical protein
METPATRTRRNALFMVIPRGAWQDKACRVGFDRLARSRFEKLRQQGAAPSSILINNDQSPKLSCLYSRKVQIEMDIEIASFDIYLACTVEKLKWIEIARVLHLWQ